MASTSGHSPGALDSSGHVTTTRRTLRVAKNCPGLQVNSVMYRGDKRVKSWRSYGQFAVFATLVSVSEAKDGYRAGVARAMFNRRQCEEVP